MEDLPFVSLKVALTTSLPTFGLSSFFTYLLYRNRFCLFWNEFCIATGFALCYNKTTVRESPRAPTRKEDKMDILNSLLQLLGGNCAGGSCAVPATQAATEAVAVTTAMGGFSGLLALLCRLLGIGC